MKLSEYFIILKSNIKSNILKLFFSFFLIFISIVLLNIIYTSINNSFITTESYNIPKLILSNKNADFINYQNLFIDKDKLEGIEGYTKNYNISYSEGFVYIGTLYNKSNQEKTFTYVVVVDFLKIKNIFPYFQKINFSENDQLLINDLVCDKLNVHKSDDLLFLSKNFKNRISAYKFTKFSKFKSNPNLKLSEIPQIYINLKYFKEYYQLEENSSFPLFITFNREINTFSIMNYIKLHGLDMLLEQKELKLIRSYETVEEVKKTFVFWKYVCFIVFFITFFMFFLINFLVNLVFIRSIKSNIAILTILGMPYTYQCMLGVYDSILVTLIFIISIFFNYIISLFFPIYNIAGIQLMISNNLEINLSIYILTLFSNIFAITINTKFVNIRYPLKAIEYFNN